MRPYGLLPHAVLLPFMMYDGAVMCLYRRKDYAHACTPVDTADTSATLRNSMPPELLPQVVYAEQHPRYKG